MYDELIMLNVLLYVQFANCNV